MRGLANEARESCVAMCGVIASPIAEAAVLGEWARGASSSLCRRRSSEPARTSAHREADTASRPDADPRGLNGEVRAVRERFCILA